jgi:hypothetical protein
MKKPPREKKRHRKGNRLRELPALKFSLLYDVFESLMYPKRVGWLYFCFCFFLVWFLGGHLVQAITSLSVANIRTTDIVHFSTAPVWFAFVVLLKLGFWLFSVAYIIVFIKRLVHGKNA